MIEDQLETVMLAKTSDEYRNAEVIDVDLDAILRGNTAEDNTVRFEDDYGRI